MNLNSEGEINIMGRRIDRARAAILFALFHVYQQQRNEISMYPDEVALPSSLLTLAPLRLRLRLNHTDGVQYIPG